MITISDYCFFFLSLSLSFVSVYLFQYSIYLILLALGMQISLTDLILTILSSFYFKLFINSKWKHFSWIKDYHVHAQYCAYRLDWKNFQSLAQYIYLSYSVSSNQHAIATVLFCMYVYLWLSKIHSSIYIYIYNQL